MDDFCKYYADLDICCMCPEFLDGSTSCHWKASVYESRWVAGTTAGGCMNFPGNSKMTAPELKHMFFYMGKYLLLFQKFCIPCNDGTVMVSAQEGINIILYCNAGQLNMHKYSCNLQQFQQDCYTISIYTILQACSVIVKGAECSCYTMLFVRHQLE